MANPRRRVDYTGIHQERVTYKADGVTIAFDQNASNGAAVAGRAVAVSADDTVALANDNDPVLGRLELVEADGMCTVTTAGYVTLPGGDAATLTPGRQIVGALGAGAARGFIKSIPAPGGAYAQAEAAAIANGRGAIVRAGDPTAVVVKL